MTMTGQIRPTAADATQLPSNSDGRWLSRVTLNIDTAAPLRLSLRLSVRPSYAAIPCVEVAFTGWLVG